MLRVVFVTCLFRVGLRLKLTLALESPAQSRTDEPNHKLVHSLYSPSQKFITLGTTWHKPPSALAETNKAWQGNDKNAFIK